MSAGAAVAAKPDRRADVLAALEAGLSAALETPASWRRYLDCAAKFHNYSFGNMLLIWQQCPQAERVAGFQTWLSLNRAVRKGERAIWIQAPMLVKVKGEPGAGAGGADDDARRMIFRPVPVFDISQTDGEPLPELPGLADGDDGGMLAALVDFAAGQGVAVLCDAQLPPGYKGACIWRQVQAGPAGQAASFGNAVIQLASSSSRIDLCGTLIHELAHALNDSPAGYREHAADMELRAESVAYMVLKHFGVDSGEQSFYYIRSYQDRAGKDAVKQLRALGKSIQETAEQIIEAALAYMAAAAAGQGVRYGECWEPCPACGIAHDACDSLCDGEISDDAVAA